MRKKIGVIAHDIVGAVEGVMAFTYYGLKPVVVFDDKIPEGVDVISSTTMSKIASPRMAYLKTRKMINRNQSRYLYLYENNLLMGNIAADIKAVMDELKPEKLLFCPAYPDRNSRVLGSRSFFGNVPSDKCVRAMDVMTPITESYIPTILSKYSELKSSSITIADVEQGPDYMANLIENCSERIIICDATQQYHLRTIGEAIMHNTDSWFACGSSGLIKEMTSLIMQGAPEYTLKPLSNNKPVLLIVGSLTDTCAIHLTTAAEKGMIYPLLVEPLDLWDRKDRENKMRKLAHKAAMEITNGKNVALTSANSRFVPQFKHVAAYMLAAIAKMVIDESDINTFYTSGADTEYAFCRTMNTKKLEVKGRISKAFSPNVVWGYTSNGKDYWLCLKSGVSGDELTITRVLRFLRTN